MNHRVRRCHLQFWRLLAIDDACSTTAAGGVGLVSPEPALSPREETSGFPIGDQLVKLFQLLLGIGNDGLDDELAHEDPDSIHIVGVQMLSK